MPKITLRAAGSQAPSTMQPGEYLAKCTRGEISTRGNKVTAVLSFLVVGKQAAEGVTAHHAGVLLRSWFHLAKLSGREEIALDISPYSKYGLAWAIAAGHPLQAGDNPEPSIFENKTFAVDVGYSSSGSDGQFSYRHTATRKSDSDFLRIHSIRRKIEENAQSHMAMNSHQQEHVFVHEHEHNAQTSTEAPAPALAVDHSSIRSQGVFHMNNERIPQRHAIPAGRNGQPTKDSPPVRPADSSPVNPDDLGDDWDVEQELKADDGWVKAR